MSGWIKLHRSIEEHWIYQEKRVFSKYEAWIDMILNVNYSDNKVFIKGKLYTIKRGESVKSLETWANRWNWDKSQVRRFFKLLENDSMIKTKSDSKTTQITICNYDSYQDVCNADATLVQRSCNTNATLVQHECNADATLTPPIKERKEYKEEKEYKNILSFDEFWDLYDKKSDRKKCENKYNSLPIKDKQKIKEVLPKYIQSTPDIQFRKNPSTWLNGKCWNDEIINQGYSSQRINNSIPTPPQNFGKSFFDLVNEQE